MLWVGLCLLKRYIEVPTPGNVTLFENRVFAGTITLRSGQTQLGWAPSAITDALRKGKSGHRHTERPCDDDGDQRDVPSSQGPPGSVGARELKGSSPGASRGRRALPFLTSATGILRGSRRCMSAVLSPPACGYSHPQSSCPPWRGRVSVEGVLHHVM